MKKLFLIILTIFLTSNLIGCTEKNSIDDKVIVVAASESPHAQILEQARAYIESKGYTLKIKVFNDYVVPNLVTDSGEVDANYFQHQPYLTNFNSKNKTNLVSVFQVHFEPLGIYQGRRTSLDDLQGAKIGIANDTSNGARGLLLLQDQGIIKLNPAKGTNVTKADIIENNYNVEIVELEAAVIPAQLPDLDFGIINGNYALSANIPTTKLLANEAKESQGALLYSNIIVVKAGYEEKEAIKVLVEALNQPNIAEYILNNFNGIVIPIN